MTTRKHLAGSLALILSLGACSSKPKVAAPEIPAQAAVTKSIETPSGYQLPPLKALTNIGDNLHPHFSDDGTRLLFESRNRPNHTQSQIYEMTMNTMVSRRVTFQDGDATDPMYLPSQDGLVYASTTDESKEDPQYVTQLIERYRAPSNAAPKPAAPNPFPSQEVYMSRLDGSWIKRLTKSPGYDGRPVSHPHKALILFTSTRRGSPELFALEGPQLGLRKFATGEKPIREAQFSPNGKKLVWIEVADEKASKIYIATESGHNATALSLPPGQFQDVSFSHDGTQLVFSANLQDTKNFEVYSFALDKKCLRRLTFDEADDLAPALRPDGQQIVFASNRSGQSQLYLMEFKPPKDCLPL